MQCHEVTALLSPYLDGAPPLAGEDATLEAHLSECAQCRGRLQSLRALKHAIARLPSREEPPGAVRAHVERLRLGQGRYHRRRMLLLALAAMVLVVTGVAIHRDRHMARLADDLVADHLSSVPEVRPAEIATDDRDAILRFFGTHVPFGAMVPTVPGAALLGARLCRIEGRRVELLFYRREDRTLSLFVIDSPVTTSNCSEARGLHVCSRSLGDVAMLLVGELPADELRRLLDETVP